MRGLSQYDQSKDATPHARQARARANGGSALPESELKFGWSAPGELAEAGLSECWCQGEACYPVGRRGWPGWEDGLPHPKNREEYLERLDG